MPPKSTKHQQKDVRDTGSRFISKQSTQVTTETSEDNGSERPPTSKNAIYLSESSDDGDSNSESSNTDSEWSDSEVVEIGDVLDKSPLPIQTRWQQQWSAQEKERRRQSKTNAIVAKLVGPAKQQAGVPRGPYKAGGQSIRTIREKKAALIKMAKKTGLPHDKLQLELDKLDRTAKPGQALQAKDRNILSFFSGASKRRHTE